MNYSFHCKHCGYTLLSNDKAEVKKRREEHYVEVARIAMTPLKVCPLVGTDKDRPAMIARPDLAIKIQEMLV